MSIQRRGHRVLTGVNTGVQNERTNATLNPKMIASQWKPGESETRLGAPVSLLSLMP